MNVCKLFEALSHLVGNTPPLAVHYTYCGRPGVIHAKSENLNMTGREEPVVDGYLTPNITLLGFRVIDRRPTQIAVPA
jgi:hypothetical protein